MIDSRKRLGAESDRTKKTGSPKRIAEHDHRTGSGYTWPLARPVGPGPGRFRGRGKTLENCRFRGCSSAGVPDREASEALAPCELCQAAKHLGLEVGPNLRGLPQRLRSPTARLGPQPLAEGNHKLHHIEGTRQPIQVSANLPKP